MLGKRKGSCLTALITLLLLGGGDSAESNPVAEGFDVVGSDAKAIALADDGMAALGGRKAWKEGSELLEAEPLGRALRRAGGA